MSVFKPFHTKNVKSEELHGKKIEVPQEDYTCQGKLQVVKTQRIIGALQILFGAALAVCGFFLNNLYPFLGNMLIFVIGIVIALFGCFSLYWGIRDTSLISQKVSTDQWYNTQDHTISRIMFTFSIMKTIKLSTLIVTLILYKDMVQGYFMANPTDDEDPQSAQNNYDKYNLFVQITLGVAALNIITLLWTTFSAYIFSNTAIAFRFSLYVFTLVALIFCGGLVYITYSSKYIENIHSLKMMTDMWSISVLFYISGVYIATLLAILVTNFVKSMNFYMSIGTLLLLVCVVLVSFNGKIYRNAKEISEFAKQNCQNEMQMIHEDSLINASCPYKYIKKEENQIYPNCEQTSQAIYWEKDIGKKNVDKQNSIECLNMKCCGLTGKVYSDWFYLMTSIGQIISMYSFVIIGICYYLSTRYSGSSSLFKKIECVFLAISILILTSWVMMMIYYEYQPISQKPGILAQLKEPNQNSENFKLYKYADVTKRAECDKSFTQYFQLYYNQPFSKNEIFDCTTDCQTKIIRIAVSTTYYRIVVSESFNDPNVKVFDSRFYSLFNNGNMQQYQDFVAAEGTIQNVKSFFTQNVCLYSFDPQSNHNMIVRVSQLKPSQGIYENLIDFKPTKKTLKRINQQKDDNETRVSFSQPFENNREKNLESNISFQSVIVVVKDAYTNKEIQNQDISVDVYFQHQECIEQNQPPQLKLNGKQSQFLVNNQYSNTYTIFVQVDGYNYSCKRVYLAEHFKTTQQIVYMNPVLKNNEIRIILEWSTHTLAQLELLATLQTDQTTDCIVGYLNENCQKIFYERKSSHPYYQSIQIDKLGADNYLFYIKHNFSQKQYKDLVNSGKKNINQILAESGAHFSIYVAGLVYPVYESGIGYFDNKFSEEVNLVWLVACMNGLYGNQVHSLNQYWSMKSSKDYILKKDDQQLPPGEICGLYLDSIYQ